ncbi:UNVERIFIED_CONTAM: hypothetical protein FKN15_015374 [Acipenser sinensis]
MAFIVHARDFLPTILSIPVVRLTLRGTLKRPPPVAPSRLPILTDILHPLISTLRKVCLSPTKISSWRPSA